MKTITIKQLSKQDVDIICKGWTQSMGTELYKQLQLVIDKVQMLEGDNKGLNLRLLDLENKEVKK